MTTLFVTRNHGKERSGDKLNPENAFFSEQSPRGDNGGRKAIFIAHLRLLT
jgi:hypothetical protein